MKKFLAITLITLLQIGLANAQGNRGPRTGDTVWTNDGYQVVVNGIFRDGRISVRLGSSNFIYTRENIAVEGCLTRRTCTGDTVWTNDRYEVKLNGLFPNRKVSVKIGSSNFQYLEQNIATPGCYSGLCSEDKAVTHEGYNVVVKGFFPNGKVIVKLGSSNFVYDVSQLASAERPPVDTDLSIGQKVWTNEGYEVTVVAIFPDGTISVKLGYSNYKYQRQNLAVEGCLRRLCTGDKAITDEGYNVTVNGFFPDRTVSVKLGYSNYRYEMRRLARTQP